MDSLFSLAEGIRKCISCPLYKSRTLAVPGDGNSKAKLMVIAESPGEEEDRLGLPFVGKSGKFLDNLFDDIKIKKKDLFITNAVKCRPPKNRTPFSKELKTCKQLWLDKQIEILKPKLILILGRVALKSVLKETRINLTHGKILQRNGYKYFVTYHPAAALRFPKIRKEMEKDFKKLKKFI